MNARDADQAARLMIQVMTESNKPGSAEIRHPDGSLTYVSWGKPSTVEGLTMRPATIMRRD